MFLPPPNAHRTLALKKTIYAPSVNRLDHDRFHQSDVQRFHWHVHPNHPAFRSCPCPAKLTFFAQSECPAHHIHSIIIFDRFFATIRFLFAAVESRPRSWHVGINYRIQFDPSDKIGQPNRPIGSAAVAPKMERHVLHSVDLTPSIDAMPDETLLNQSADHGHQNYAIRVHVDWLNRHTHNIHVNPALAQTQLNCSVLESHNASKFLVIPHRFEKDYSLVIHQTDLSCPASIYCSC